MDLLSSYSYTLPPHLIATSPASPRDSARLLSYNIAEEKVTLGTFSNLARFLPKNTLLVFNDTHVIPARLEVYKKTGGRVRILFIEKNGSCIKVLADRKMEVKSTVRLNEKISFHVESHKENFYFLKPSFPLSRLFSVFEKYGLTPLPPYIKNSPLTETQAREKYQTVFARTRGSVAAPTASLHFTKRLLKKLAIKGIESTFITLHVNMGTFAPVTEEALKKGRLHTEYFEVPTKTAALILSAKKEGRPIIAVGTTVVRTLESACDAHITLRPFGPAQRRLAQGDIIQANTDLFIRPGYQFKVVDGLITNFHVPNSSLMMLVAAFLDYKTSRAGQKPQGREKLLELYVTATKNNFRFFSFGDGMLLY